MCWGAKDEEKYTTIYLNMKSICVKNESELLSTLIIPISVCYYSLLHNAIIVQWECNIVPSNKSLNALMFEQPIVFC